jgi:hypothetical protein
MLTALRILNIAIWTGLLAYMLPAARSAVTGRDTRRGDPMRLGVASVCLVIILGNIRWLIAPDSQPLFLALYVLTAIVGVYKIILARTYGRGPRL